MVYCRIHKCQIQKLINKRMQQNSLCNRCKNIFWKIKLQSSIPKSLRLAEIVIDDKVCKIEQFNVTQKICKKCWNFFLFSKFCPTMKPKSPIWLGFDNDKMSHESCHEFGFIHLFFASFKPPKLYYPLSIP